MLNQNNSLTTYRFKVLLQPQLIKSLLTTPNHGNPHSQISPVLFGRDIPATDLLMQVLVSAESSKAKINDLAVAAADELIQKACALEPLWMFDEDKETETLNVPKYQRRFASLGSTLEEIIKSIAVGGEPLELSDGLAANYAKFQGEEGGDKPPPMIFPVGNGQASLQTEASREQQGLC